MRMFVFLTLTAVFCLQAQQKEIKRVPVKQTPIDSGQTMFKTYCATCHGAGGKGDGPAASALKMPPSDLTQLARNHGGKFPDEFVVTKLKFVDQPVHGSKDMPVWGSLLSSVSRDPAEVQLRIDNIVSYISSIQAK